MNHFLIITNEFKDKGLVFTEKIRRYIEARGGSCQCYSSTGDDARHAAPDSADIAEGTECVLVLGGDGTLIRAAAKLVDEKLPLIGVNLGTLGYLCELEAANVFDAIDELMDGHYMLEERMMLSAYGIKNGIQTEAKTALNDVVIHRTGALSVVNLIVSVNGEYLNTFRADGIIISTPTGSTGYNLSAGGPVMVPNLKAMVVTPICAHSLNKRSLVVDSKEKITLEIGQTKDVGIDLAMVTADGRTIGELSTGDKLVLEVPHATTRLIKLSEIGFYERMREKLNGEL